MLEVINWIIENGAALIAGIIGLFSAALAIALIIPGPQPDKFLQGIVDFLTQFSRK